MGLNQTLLILYGFYPVLMIEIPVNSDFDIVGFEIIDNSLRGWERAKRFYVNDYEEETISFYCESFEISNIQEA